MANFEKQGKSIHGTAQSITAGQTFVFGLWGPWYKSNPGGSTWDLELDVTTKGNTLAKITKGRVTSDPPVREYSVVANLTQGTYTIEAKDRTGAVWTTFDLEVMASTAPSGRRRYTTKQLTTKDGTMGWPGWQGACPCVQALASQLASASANALAKGTSLQGSGHISTIDEHYSGLSLDIMLHIGKPDQKLHAHNLIRFFVANRASMGWLHIFYDQTIFTQNGIGAGNAPGGHDSHIHIDWFDASLAEPAGYSEESRSSRVAITWPEVATTSGVYLASSGALEGMREAWNSTEALFSSPAGLY